MTGWEGADEKWGFTRAGQLGGSSEEFESLVDEIGGALIGVAGTVELHGAVAFVMAGVENAEGFGHIDVNELAFFVGFHGFDVADAVGVFKHFGDALVGVVGFSGGQSVGKIRVGVQPGIVHFFDDADDEEGIFTERIVVFEIDEDAFGGAVFGNTVEAVRGAIHVRLRVFRRRHVGADAGRADGCSYVDPFFAESDGLIALGFVRSEGAVFAIHRNIYDGAPGFFDEGAQFAEEPGIDGAEMLAPRLDLVDVESRLNEDEEILQVHLRDGGRVRLVVSASDGFAEGVGSDGNAIARRRRKLQVGSSDCGEGRFCGRQQHRGSGSHGGLNEKSSSSSASSVRQSGVSLAESPCQTSAKRTG